MAGLTGGDDEARARGIGEIEQSAVAAGLRARQRRAFRRVEAAAAVKRIKIAAGGKREIAPPIKARRLAENLVLKQRRLLGAPAPSARVVALADGEALKRAVERAGKRRRAVRVRRADLRVVVDERQRRGGEQRAKFRIQVDAGLVGDQRLVQFVKKRLGDGRLGPSGLDRK